MFRDRAQYRMAVGNGLEYVMGRRPLKPGPPASHRSGSVVAVVRHAQDHFGRRDDCRVFAGGVWSLIIAW